MGIRKEQGKEVREDRRKGGREGQAWMDGWIILIDEPMNQ